MGFIAALSGLFMKPITFFEHEGRETAEKAKSLLQEHGIKVSMVDVVTTTELGTNYVINVNDYDASIKILDDAGIL